MCKFLLLSYAITSFSFAIRLQKVDLFSLLHDGRGNVIRSTLEWGIEAALTFAPRGTDVLNYEVAMAMIYAMIYAYHFHDVYIIQYFLMFILHDSFY